MKMKRTEISAKCEARSKLGLYLRRQGMTFREIGEKLGVGAARAQQIVNRGRRYEKKAAIMNGTCEGH